VLLDPGCRYRDGPLWLWFAIFYPGASHAERSNVRRADCQVGRSHPSSGKRRSCLHPRRAQPRALRKGSGLCSLSTERRSRQSRENQHATNLLSYPLTRQEKLLLQFAHHAKPADLQALNPEYQAKVEAQQDAEFAAYLKSGSSFDTESATQSNDSTQE